MDGKANSDGDLRSVLIRTLGDDAFDDLFARARPVRFARGETIFSVGDPGTGVIVIDKGRVEVSTMSVSGRKSVLAYMAPGELLGEIAALDGGNRSADAVAATEVEGRFLTRENMLDYIAGSPELSKAVIVELCKKARNASEMFVTQTLPTAEVRLARALLRLFDGWGVVGGDGTTVLVEQFSQQDLGEFCGLARENVSRQIKAWVAQDLLETRGRQLVLLDRARLQEIAAA
jgi:CRP-like cAMP-binding protein